jgi:hypothetical protein
MWTNLKPQHPWSLTLHTVPQVSHLSRSPISHRHHESPIRVIRNCYPNVRVCHGGLSWAWRLHCNHEGTASIAQLNQRSKSSGHSAFSSGIPLPSPTLVLRGPTSTTASHTAASTQSQYTRKPTGSRPSLTHHALQNHHPRVARHHHVGSSSPHAVLHH